MDRSMSLGDDAIDWGDVNFSTPDYTDAMADSPWGNTALNDFTNLGDNSDGSPVAVGIKSSSRSAVGVHSSSQQPPRLPSDLMGMPLNSTESSSQDSASDSSSQRKRKTTSESPISDPATERNLKAEDAAVATGEYTTASSFAPAAYRHPLPNLSVESSMSDNGETMFDFQSAASSPNLNREFNQHMSLDPKMKFPGTNPAHQFTQESPVSNERRRSNTQILIGQQLQTINPGIYTLSSRDQSPATTNMMFNTASPNAIFSTPSSDSTEPFHAGGNWAQTVGPNNAWAGDFTNQFTSPGGLGLTPSPMASTGATPAPLTRGVVAIKGRSPLHIGPISAKSRVETQINVVMTLERPPPGIEQLHLPLHTIAKSKLLAKEDCERSKVLELHTMLVCTSAMHNPVLKEKALRRAAAQDNEEIQRRAEQAHEPGEEDRNDPKNIPDDDKPLNGGEVRICPNCILRERKRAGRKKLKREEEQQHWERYETERVVVFNSNEYLAFKPFDPAQQPQKEHTSAIEEPYTAPDGAISVAAAMRIACYCRHQTEKEGFQVIFTLKDHQGNVVAQQLSDSILITDDHKTHPSSMTTVPGDVFYASSGFHNGASGLPQSQSMVDLSAHQQPFQSSRSTGNLQSLGYGQQFNPHSHVHQMQQPGFASQTTSATMTPTTLSRPGSPSNAGQSGPNKKRKSSTFHRRVPSGLQMTPRVDTNQTSSSTISSAVSTQMPGTFSPNMGHGFNQTNDASFIAMPPNNGNAVFFNSGPNTPANEAGPFAGSSTHQLDLTRSQNASAYFSHPSSTVPSRSTSPVLQHGRPNLAAYGRQPIQTPTNSMGRPATQGMFASPTALQSQQGQQQAPSAAQLSAAVTPEEAQSTAPIISKITPSEGPVSGGTEVSIFGYNFTHGTQIMFGDAVAPTTFYGSQCILATSPPGRRGVVRVASVPLPGQASAFASPVSAANQPVFTYKEGLNPQMMEMALRFLTQQQIGDSTRWIQYTNEVANQFMATSISPAGIGGSGGQGFGGNNAAAGIAGGGGGLGSGAGAVMGVGSGNLQQLQHLKVQQQQQQPRSRVLQQGFDVVDLNRRLTLIPQQ